MRYQMFASTLFIVVIIFSNSNILCINMKFVSGQLSDDKQLLLELKNNLIYDSSLSTKLVHWNESTDYCRWVGVKCGIQSRVLSLDLSHESITGGINDSESSIFKLVHLRSLNLAQNSFDSSELPLGFGKLANLRYLNLSNSGFSGQIKSDFSDLSRLVILDLSSTFYSSLELQNPNFEKMIRNFTRLRELHLDGVNISAQGHVWCTAVSSFLPNLGVLSLSNSYLTGPFDSSLIKLQSLSIIRLDGNTFSSPFPDFFADFPNLRILTLSSCDLFGEVPEKIFQIKSLETIDLSGNRDLEGSFPDFPSNGSLQNLLLSYTNFSGNLSNSIGNLRVLTNVDLRACRFTGPVPGSINILTQLVYLDLSLNQFLGSVPSFALLKNLTVINLHGNRLTGRISNSLWEGLENLDFLDLSENLLQGEIPASLFVLRSLKVLHLSSNSFNGSIKDTINSSSSSLEVLDLSVNNLEGPIPRFLFELRNISSLSFSSNKINDSIELTDFQKLTNLVNLDFSYNYISVLVNEEVFVSSLFPRLGSLMLSSCNLKKIPLLMNHSSLMMLDLSDNQLNGEIPNWIFEVGGGFLRFLNLSHNQFSHFQEPYDLRSLHYLDLHSNLLSGKIPILPPSAVLIDLSSNNFSSSLPANISKSLTHALYFSIANNKINGDIPPSLCNASRVQILDLSNNSLRGEIPFCLLRNIELRVLNLRRNNFDGDIPNTFPSGCGLETLDLSFNALQGKVPKSLSNCTEIEVLNLGNNALNDTFPCWLKNSSKLRVLVLRSNNFHGNISCLSNSNITWPNLQIIDIASNFLDGILPENLFRNMNSLTIDDENGSKSHLHFVFLIADGIYYQDSMMMTLKGQELEMEKILTIFTSIDLSDNNFRGRIPEAIGQLASLYVLNLSLNSFSGPIPASIGNLRNLESLDFSFNSLSEEIPRKLASVPFLSFLNLSYNQLVGRIPSGSQMQTFPESSFMGNEGLCGFPLSKNCSDVGEDGEFPEDKSEEKGKLDWDIGVYVSSGLGFVVGLVGVVFAPLVFCDRWRRCFNKHVNRFVLLVLGWRLGNEDW